MAKTAGQLAFWAASELIQKRVEVLDMPGADVTFCPRFFEPAEARDLFDRLRAEVPWPLVATRRMMYERMVDTPRVGVWYGTDREGGHQPWLPVLRLMRSRIEDEVGRRFNAVYVQLYRDGQDSVAWHSDREAQVASPVIASLSLGATRRFLFKHKTRKDLSTIALDLVEGTLLVMAGETQQHWLHHVPKTLTPVAERINLTFRIVKE